MSEGNKRFYWLKLSDDFFRQKEIKQLRRIAGGDLYTIIYLKMLLCSMDTGGKLYYEGISDDFASELALDIDEEVENVRVTIQFLISKGILIENTVSEYELTTSKEMVGSECGSARRMRKKRAADALAAGVPLIASHSDTDVTERDTEKETRVRDREKSKSKRFIPPSVQEIREYVTEMDYPVDPERFFDYYETRGWIAGKTKMKDWKAAVRLWARNQRESVAEKPAPQPQKKAPPAVAYRDPNNWWNGMTRDEFMDAVVPEYDKDGNVIGNRFPDGRFVAKPR